LEFADETVAFNVKLQITIAGRYRTTKVVLAAPDQDALTAHVPPKHRDCFAEVVRGVENTGGPLDVDDAGQIIAVVILCLLRDSVRLLTRAALVFAARGLHNVGERLEQRPAVSARQVDERVDG